SHADPSFPRPCRPGLPGTVPRLPARGARHGTANRSLVFVLVGRVLHFLQTGRPCLAVAAAPLGALVRAPAQSSLEVCGSVALCLAGGLDAAVHLVRRAARLACGP